MGRGQQVHAPLEGAKEGCVPGLSPASGTFLWQWDSSLHTVCVCVHARAPKFFFL